MIRLQRFAPLVRLSVSCIVFLAVTPAATADQAVTIPFFTLEGMDSLLTLNNNMPQSTSVAITLFNQSGRPLVIPGVTVPPRSVVQLDLRSLVGENADQYSYGSIRLQYVGPSMGVTCQVTVVSNEKGLSFESVETSPMEFASSTLNAIVWLPDSQTQAQLAMTNASSKVIKVAMSLAGRNQSLTLTPRQTRIVDLKDAAGDASAFPALLRLSHDGLPGALVGTGFLLNRKSGFSSNLSLVDPATAGSARLSGAHFRSGSPDPTEGFPAATSFSAPLLLANVGATATRADVYVDYSIGADMFRLQAASLNISPGQIAQIQPGDALARAGINGGVSDAGVDISYDAEPGALIGLLTSADQTGQYSFDTPIKDPLSIPAAQSSYPWRLDSGHRTVVHLKNTTDREATAIAQIRFDGGTYNLDRIKLKPYQTFALDLETIKNSHKPDIRGNTWPETALQGQVVWFDRVPGTLIGRAERWNVASGMASSFSCPGPCACPPNVQSTWMSPSSFIGPVGAQGTPFTPFETDVDCNGETYGPLEPAIVSWSSNDTTVASVDSGGTVSCLNPGHATISSLLSVPMNTDVGGACRLRNIQQTTGGGLTAENVTVTLSPTSVAAGGSVTVTVNIGLQEAEHFVSLQKAGVDGTGGHQHFGSRPSGTLDATSGVTNASGVFTTGYTTTAFGGRERITATVDTMNATADVSVGVMALTTLGAGANYTLTGNNDDHPANHYGTAAANSNLGAIANAYASLYPGSSLSYNDQSLVNGGLFDIGPRPSCTNCQFWNTPHDEHRFGINCDVSDSNVPNDRWTRLEQIFSDNNSPNFLHETAKHHWHLRFQ